MGMFNQKTLRCGTRRLLVLGSLLRYEGRREGRELNPFYDKKQDKVCALNRSTSVFPKAILQTHAHKRTHTQSLVAL